MKDLKNKVLIVTGAGSGIGRALALSLAREGVQLALNDWNPDTLKATVVSLLEERHSFAFSQAFDVSDRSAWASFIADVKDHFGRIDGLINNAGITTFPQTIPETDNIDFSRVLQTNLWGVIHGCQLTLPYLMEQESSLLVNVSSLLGLMGYAGQGPYVTAKFAVTGFTETLRQELAGTGVLVTTIHPGPVKTNLTRNIKHTDQELLEKLSDVFEKAAVTTPETAAALIIKGIKRGKHRVLISPRTSMLDRLVRLLPNSYHRFLPRNFRPGHLIKKALEQRKRERKDRSIVG